MKKVAQGTARDEVNSFKEKGIHQIIQEEKN